jgi:hypothetical protein
MTMTTVRGSSLKRLFGAAVLALASAGAAQAAVITFEGITGPATNQDAFLEAGFQVAFYDPGAEAPAGTVQIGRLIDGSDPADCGAGNVCPTDDTSTYVDLFNSGFIDILPLASDATFSFGGLDASFIALSGTDYPPTPAAIQVIGFLADGSSTSIQFNVPRTTVFQIFNAADAVDGEAFAKMSFIEIAVVGYRCNAQGACSGLDDGDGQVGLDNIRLSDVPISDVPEPATTALMAAGLLGLGLRARRRS